MFRHIPNSFHIDQFVLAPSLVRPKTWLTAYSSNNMYSMTNFAKLIPLTGPFAAIGCVKLSAKLYYIRTSP